jgi:hydrogenase maturation protease
MSPPRILIAGIGNIFLGDDAFGVEVARKLLERAWPPDVRVVDFGIRGLDLVYALLDGCETAILIDAVARRGGPPGTLYLLQPQLDAADAAPAQIDAHSMDPLKVLRTAAAMGARPGAVYIVGVEPSPQPNFDEGEVALEMSAPVSAAVAQAVAMVESLVESLVEKAGAGAGASPPAPAQETPTWP